ncbi:unnamed protein product [Mycena citricolor]|uniref:Reverse transcriptase domain-containing protein n=1 Tax=Mycena citricolor TaxID=2018698 RepID=A0AAD2K1F8_9AGAR|nr:unnamed protein product [Mycena citricolor]
MDVYVQITGLDSGKTRGVKALLDSGCSTCCINTDYAQAEKLDIQELPQPIVARNADNTENISGRITHYVDLRMRIGLFIGLDWLTEHNPEVDWQEQTMRFSRCPERCHMRGHEEHQAMIDMDAIDLETGAPDLEEGESILLIDFGKEVDLRLKETPAQKFAEEAEKEKERMTEGKIPDQYWEFVKVFAKELFDSLPDRRAWDHAIELKPGSKEVDCKVYPLSRNEQVKLDEFLQENLASGRIRPSKSPMASAFFFVKKKDGSLCPVQDYRKLNEMTIRNRYPLPLISELVHNLCGAKFFTKLDIRWGYNNVRIKEGNEWKAAFRTNRGLYEPLVMFFGLTNSPATFQNMMNDILRELINEGHVVVYLDDILIFTENLDEHRRTTKRVLELLQKTQVVPEARKVRVRTHGNRIFGCNYWTQFNADGPSQDQGRDGMARTKERQTSPSLPRVHQLLSTLCPGICGGCQAIDTADREGRMVMGYGGTCGIRWIEEKNRGGCGLSTAK